MQNPVKGREDQDETGSNSHRDASAPPHWPWLPIWRSVCLAFVKLATIRI